MLAEKESEGHSEMQMRNARQEVGIVAHMLQFAGPKGSSLSSKAGPPQRQDRESSRDAHVCLEVDEVSALIAWACRPSNVGGHLKLRARKLGIGVPQRRGVQHKREFSVLPSLARDHELTHRYLSSLLVQYSGLVNNKAVGIEPASSGKGIVISTKKSKSPSNKVAGTWNTQTIKKGGSRRYAGAVANVVGKKGYRADLLKVSLEGPKNDVRSGET